MLVQKNANKIILMLTKPVADEYVKNNAIPPALIEIW